VEVGRGQSGVGGTGKAVGVAAVIGIYLGCSGQGHILSPSVEGSEQLKKPVDRQQNTQSLIVSLPLPLEKCLLPPVT
jgi:hypothetical protein